MNWPTTTLNDEIRFEWLNGLWKGERPPFTRAVVVRNTNFRNDGRLDLRGAAVLDVESRKLATRALQPGDIVLERSGGGPKQPVGRVCFFEATGTLPHSFSNFTSVLRVKQDAGVLPKFVHYYLLHLYKVGYTENLQRATTGIRNLDFTAYCSTLVPMPSLGEQVRVVQMLDQAMQCLATAESAIQLTCELKHAATAELFSRGLHGEAQRTTEIGPVPESWDVLPLGDLREFLQYGTSAKCNYMEGGTPVLRIPNIMSGRVDTSDIKSTHLSPADEKALRLEDGDVLFVRTNGVRERVGSTAVYHGSPPQASFASYLIRARLMRERLLPEFLNYFTATHAGVAQLGGRATPAADGKFNINTKNIDGLLVPVPSLEEQRKMIDILTTIDERLGLYERKRVLLTELFETLLHDLMMDRRHAASHPGYAAAAVA